MQSYDLLSPRMEEEPKNSSQQAECNTILDTSTEPSNMGRYNTRWKRRARTIKAQEQDSTDVF